MNLNFIEEFKNYSNLELLKIIKNPTHYQQAAVDAAQTILSTRTISNEEVQKVDDDLATTREQGTRNDKGIFKSVFRASSDEATSKWLKFLWLALAVQYAKTLYGFLPSVIYFLRCKFCPFDYVWAFSFLNILYMPVVFFLLARKSKSGWVLLFGETIFTGVSLQILFLQTMVQIIKSIYYLDFPQLNVSDYLWFVLIRTFVVIMLLKEEVTKHFNVNDQTKIWTIMVASFLDAILILYLGYRISGINLF